MATSQTSGVIQHLRRVLRDGAGLTDGQLLEDYISRRDDAAVAALVRRHGPMVWGVCRRVLRNEHDAEDAFQATFLVLVRRAASIASRELLANWLYGVAHQTALKARATVAKRKGRERQVTEMPEPAVTEQDHWRDLQPLLDEELSRLPDKYRGVVVLCDLEGKTRKEAARHLGLPEGTVGSRLARARVLLAKRLTRRGVALSGGALAAMLAREAAAGMPNWVADSTIKAASLFVAGQAAAGAISFKAAALTEGVMKAMLFNKLKSAIAVVLILGLMATGATLLSCRKAAGQDDNKPVAEKPVEPAAKQEKEKETFTAWGKEVGGLQAGLGYPPGEHRAYHIGETVRLVIRVRNVGKEAVEFKHIYAFFVENPPTMTDADGKIVKLPPGRSLGLEQGAALPLHRPRSTNLSAGDEADIYKWEFDLQPKGGIGINKEVLAIHGTGKFSLQCERVVGPTIANPNHPNPTLDKLATGKLELEVKDAEKLPETKEEKEAFTAWGNEQPGGVQVGLGYLPGERRSYRTGETVTLVVRARNIGKQDANLEYMREYLQNSPPRIVDGEGKKYPMPTTFNFFGEQTPVQATLAPGKESELYNLKFVLRPVSEKSNSDVMRIYGTGKFQIQETGLLGNCWIGRTRTNTALSGMFSGILELEVKEAQKVPENNEKEAFTAWGEEPGGLQAGLGYPPGEHRAYHIGATVTLVVRVRNVGKEAVKFQYLRQFFMETPPTVTDGDGKPVHFRYGWIDESIPQIHVPVDVTLAPGKEIALYELKLPLRPANEGKGENDTPFYGTGKFQIQYERVFGNSSTGKVTPDPTLSKLATGKLELEINGEKK
jgi:RNA polymerase sigma factor (sigma-70 family)